MFGNLLNRIMRVPEYREYRIQGAPDYTGSTRRQGVPEYREYQNTGSIRIQVVPKYRE